MIKIATNLMTDLKIRHYGHLDNGIWVEATTATYSINGHKASARIPFKTSEQGARSWLETRQRIKS